MTGSDAFSEYYAELLQGTYDCVDRVGTQRIFSIRADWGWRPYLVAMVAWR